MIEREEAAKLADIILTASGSGLRHYTPQSRERIIEAAREYLDNFLDKLARVG